MARRAQYRVAGWPAVQRAESLAGSYGVRDLKAGSYWVGTQSCDAQALRAGSGGVRNLRAGSGGVRNLMAPLPFNKTRLLIYRIGRIKIKVKPGKRECDSDKQF